jgi:hypothetical protein
MSRSLSPGRFKHFYFSMSTRPAPPPPPPHPSLLTKGYRGRENYSRPTEKVDAATINTIVIPHLWIPTSKLLMNAWHGAGLLHKSAKCNTQISHWRKTCDPFTLQQKLHERCLICRCDSSCWWVGNSASLSAYSNRKERTFTQNLELCGSSQIPRTPPGQKTHLAPPYLH